MITIELSMSTRLRRSPHHHSIIRSTQTSKDIIQEIQLILSNRLSNDDRSHETNCLPIAQPALHIVFAQRRHSRECRRCLRRLRRIQTREIPARRRIAIRSNQVLEERQDTQCWIAQKHLNFIRCVSFMIRGAGCQLLNPILIGYERKPEFFGKNGEQI